MWCIHIVVVKKGAIFVTRLHCVPYLCYCRPFIPFHSIYWADCYIRFPFWYDLGWHNITHSAGFLLEGGEGAFNPPPPLRIATIHMHNMYM